MDKFISLPSIYRVIIIIILAIMTYFVVKEIRQLSQWLLTRKLKGLTTNQETFMRQYPKLATITTIIVSALTFMFYFFAIGLIFGEFGIKLTTYLASASVIGLAIGFGSQGFVQDVVMGLTLIFTDAMNIGDTVELSGQIGKVDRIGLRFTILLNLHGQEIFIPNRNIGIIGRYRKGVTRAFVDIQLFEKMDNQIISEKIFTIAKSMFNQYKSIILSQPELIGIKEAKPAGWQYLRIKFRIWPGQGTLIEYNFKQRVLAELKKISEEYSEWLITVTYRID